MFVRVFGGGKCAYRFEGLVDSERNDQPKNSNALISQARVPLKAVEFGAPALTIYYDWQA
jgi:hypothetical protein